MLISKSVKVNICNSNREYYKSLGFEDIKNGDTIEIPVSKLSKGSCAIVEYTCDYCGEPLTAQYKNYIQRIDNILSKTACKNCSGKKIRESNMIKYGVPSPMCLETIQQKAKETTLKHYGVEHSSQCLEIIERTRQTNMKRYGVEHISKTPEFQERIKETRLKNLGVPYALQSPDIQEKVRLTTLERYGVENASQSEEIKQKKKDTCLKNYGVEYGSQSPIIKEKMVNSLYNNQTIPTSSQQLYICNLYNMELNFPIGCYNVDMCDIDNKIICEYDGGGHRLSVKLGEVSEEEFNQKEIIRNNVIKRKGYKIFRIISQKDRLPSEDVLFKILNYSKEYFCNYPNHSWIEFDIDNNCIRNAEYKNGVSFNFGKTKSTY